MGKGSGRVKQKKVGGMDSKELNDMFGAMMGGSNIDPMIALDKFTKIRGLINDILTKLDKFNNTIVEKLININSRYSIYKKEINNFIEDCNHVLSTVTLNMETISADYARIKENDQIKEFTLLCRNLIRYKSSLDKMDNLCPKFIYNTPGSSQLELFPFSSFDFAFLFKFEDIKKDDLDLMKRYILIMLHFLMKDSYTIYDTINSPDIDTERFSEVLIEAINKARSQLPRCNKAFDLISNSTNLLTNNFNTYYKDFIQTKNGSIIMESFISDVMSDAMGDNIDYECVRQLKDIISFIKSNNQNRPKNPQIDKLFDTLNEKMSFVDDELDKYMRENKEEEIEINN
jgi:hypothetical protein